MSWLLAFLGFAALIVLHEAGHFAAAKAVGMRVERFALFFPPLLARVRRGETEYAVGAIPLGGYVKITGMNPAEDIPPEAAHRAYYRQPVWKRIVVISAGPAVNIVLAFLIFAALYWVNGVAMGPQRVEQVEPGTPAAGVLQDGDVILAADGERIDGDTIAPQLQDHRCAGEPTDGCRAETPATLLVRRDGTRRTVEITPFYDAERRLYRVGFRYEPDLQPVGPVRASEESVASMWAITSGTVSTIAQIFKPEVREELSGVVGGYERTRQSFEISAEQAVFLLGIISLSLGVINLFPFLPLDGGHIFWAAAEKVRGRAISFQTMERAGFVGFALVIMLFLIGFTNDLDRLTGEGFGVR